MWNEKTEVFSELLLRIPRNVAALPCKGRDGVGSRRPDAPGAGQVRRDADRAALRDPQLAPDKSDIFICRLLPSVRLGHIVEHFAHHLSIRRFHLLFVFFEEK